MNRNYRILWSESRQQWVVADELASIGGKGKSRGALSRLVCAALVACGMLAGASDPALADSCPTNSTSISTVVDGQCVVTGTDTVTITAAGTLKDTANTAPGVISVDAGATGVTIDNSGTLGSGTGKTIDVNAAASGTTITNRSGATIFGRFTSIKFNSNLDGALTNNGSIKGVNGSQNKAIWINSSSLTGTLSNTGTIQMIANGSTTASASGILINVNLSGSLTNSGTITGTATVGAGGSSPASAIGILVGQILTGSLTNSGTLTMSATNNGTDNAFATVIKVNTISGAGVLTNSGSITGTAVATQADAFQHAFARGIFITQQFAKTLNNTGTITVSASGAAISNEVATGIRIANMTGGTLSNSGTVSATASKGAVNAYSLRVLASTGGTINNQAGGVLKGRLAVAGTAPVNNAGTIWIPDGVTGSIAGNYTQQAGGKLKIGASSAGSFGKLTVGGTADLTASGAFDVDVAGVNTLAAGNTLTGVLVASGGLNTGAITVTDNSALFDFTGAVNGKNDAISLSVVAAAAGGGASTLSSVRGTGFTAGNGAAKEFDDLIGGAAHSADMSTVITALGKLPTGQQVSDAVAQTLPLMAGGMQQTSLDTARGISHALEGRLADMQGMASGDSFFGSGKLWIKPFGSVARQHDRSGASGFDANTYGLMVGVDKDVSDDASLAMAFAWGRSFVDSNNGFNSADVNAFQLAVTGSFNLAADTFVKISANGGINRNDGRRTVTFGGLSRLASSSYNSWTAHGGVEAGHRFAVHDKVSLTPSLRVDYAVIRDNSYSETGAGALNLNVASHTTDELLLGGDVKFAYMISDTATFNASAGAAYDALQEQASSTSLFAGGSGAAFATRGINPPRWLGRGDANLTFRTASNMDVVVAYNVEGRRDFLNHTGSVKLAWAF